MACSGASLKSSQVSEINNLLDKKERIIAVPNINSFDARHYNLCSSI